MTATHNQDRLGRLRAFGLSDYAARAYLALLDLGIAEARDVSTLSKVPQAKIYAVLEQLQEKGLVLVLPEFPKKYAPVPFEEHLQRLFEEHTRAAATIEREREELAALFRVVGDAEVGDRGFFTVLRGRRNVLGRLEEIAEATRRTLLVLATPGSLARADSLVPTLAAARARGVDVRVVAPIEAATLPALARLAPHARVRARDLREDHKGDTVAIVVSDAERAFLIHFVPDDGSLEEGKDVGVHTDQDAMVAAILAILDPLWDRATPYETRREEIEAGRLPAFTRVHPSGAEAWRAFQDALQRGGREVRYLDGSPAGAPLPDAEAIAATLEARGGSLRAVLNLPTPSVVSAYEALERAHPGLSIRHLSPQVSARCWLLDDREGFFAIAPMDGRGQIVVHTSEPAALRSMISSFDAAWDLAAPLPLRRQELEIFPRLQPGDLGIGMLFNLLGDAVVVADSHGRVVLWNPAAEETFGYDVQEALGLHLGALVPPEERERSLGWLARRPARSERLDPDRVRHARGLRKDGSIIDLEVMARQIDAPRSGGPYALVVLRDVTARLAAADAERRSRDRILRIYESMQDAFFALDRDWRLIYMNPVAEQMRTAPKERVLGQVLWEAFPDLKGSRFETEYRRAMRDNVAVSVEEHYPRMGRWFEAKAYPGEEGLSVYYRDVTARKEGEARFARAFENAPLGVVIVGEGGRFLQANRAFCRMVGLDEAALRERALEDVTAPADLHASRAAVGELVHKGAASAVLEEGYVRPDGSVVRARTTLSLVRRDPLEVVAHVQEMG